MSPDDLRQITDAVYYVAHVIGIAAALLYLLIAIFGWLVMVQLGSLRERK